MKVNELFKTNNSDHKNDIFKVISNPEDRCEGCIAFDRLSFCLKLPDCGNEIAQVRIKFIRLNPNEVRQAIKNKTVINQY